MAHVGRELKKHFWEYTLMFTHICEHRIKYTIHKQAKKSMYTKIETKNEENN